MTTNVFAAAGVAFAAAGSFIAKRLGRRTRVVERSA
jgi:HAMP domain-containing protein